MHIQFIILSIINKTKKKIKKKLGSPKDTIVYNALEKLDVQNVSALKSNNLSLRQTINFQTVFHPKKYLKQIND